MTDKPSTLRANLGRQALATQLLKSSSRGSRESATMPHGKGKGKGMNNIKFVWLSCVLTLITDKSIVMVSCASRERQESASARSTSQSHQDPPNGEQPHQEETPGGTSNEVSRIEVRYP
jgi:hypothetical protein